jgi:hypothetical protein
MFHRAGSLLLLFALAVAPAPAGAADLPLEASGRFGPGPQSEPTRLSFEVRDGAQVVVLNTFVAVQQGNVTVRVTAPGGATVFEATTTGEMKIDGQALRTSGTPGPYGVEVVPQEAVGTWTVRVEARPGLREVYLTLVAAACMVAVGVAAVLGWRLYSGVPWRWFWAGAVVWAVGVALKFAWALPLNTPVLAWFKAVLPAAAFLPASSVYVGLLTGVFEVGITLAAALLFRGMCASAARGVAVGVGAGAVEAVLLGLATTIAPLVALAGTGEAQEASLRAITAGTGATPLFWLAGPAERVIAVLCHTTSRALVLLGVARGRWTWLFAAGFLLLSAVDVVAGYVHLAGALGRVSTWWIELALTPAALVSIPVLVACVRRWPAPSTPQESPPDGHG